MDVNIGGARMSKKISTEDVKHVAHLARLAITDEEAEKYSEQLELDH